MKIYSHETSLLIGDTEKLPFDINQEIDIDKLQEDVKNRLEYGIASQSGIRQIFDPDYGDAPTSYSDGEDLTKYKDRDGAEITDAAKIHVATIADTFVELLKNRTGKTNLTILVAIDSRHTGPAIADIIVRIFAFHGVKVKYTFITPVTEMVVYSRKDCDGFIYISASHNPWCYNGLKLGLNDGCLLHRELANEFIGKYQSRLANRQNTEAMIDKLRDADVKKVEEIYNDVLISRNESREIYNSFSDMLITGLKDPSEVAKRKSQLREKIAKLNIWVGIDYNGGARSDKEYLQSWGFKVHEINSRPRIDISHNPSPVPSACQQAKDELIKLQNEGKNIVAFFVYDTDGDRKNIVIPDGKGGAEIPGVQMIFALDVLCATLNIKLSSPDDKVAIVVNDATSCLIDQLAQSLDFAVKKVEVGEANVASAGVSLSKQGICVPIMGEGSNGSVFNTDLLVREPLHTIRTIIDFITKPELTKHLLKALNHEEFYDDWHSNKNIMGLICNIIKSLPPSFTTDFFTNEGTRKGSGDLNLNAFKANFDKYFEPKLWDGIKEIIKLNYQIEPTYEFVSNEGEEELWGYGNRKTGKGGYKIELYITEPNKKRLIGWLWFRTSATELGVMRKGVSILHWEISPQSKIAAKNVYDYIDKAFSDALNKVEDMTLEGNS